MLDPSRVLFVGLGKSAVGWYRCYLPAMHMGADWVGLAGEPPEMVFQTGLVKGTSTMPNFEDYDVVVLQQPRGQGWFRIIKRLQSKGVKVVFEVDDYLHAIHKMPEHDYKEFFSKDELARLELNMRACDALVCSTPYIGRRYHTFNQNVWVCRNGVDLGRYRLTRPPRPTVNIGWAGATGHNRALAPWLTAVGRVMAERPATTFVTIGMNYADALETAFPNRTLSIPFTLIDTYPSAMTMFDVALAPAGKSAFFQGKSDLRWLEAAALGVPIVADPQTYPDITHGVDGFHANSAAEVPELLRELVDDEELRTRVGANARKYVEEKRDMRVAVRQWEAMFEALLEIPAAATAS